MEHTIKASEWREPYGVLCPTYKLQRLRNGSIDQSMVKWLLHCDAIHYIAG